MEQCLQDTDVKEGGRTSLGATEGVDLLEELSGNSGFELNDAEEMVEGGEKVTHAKGTRTSLFAGNRKAENSMNLTYIPPQIANGSVVAQIDKSETEIEELKWRRALIVYAIGETPGYNMMVQYVQQKWSGVVMPKIFLHDERYCISYNFSR